MDPWLEQPGVWENLHTSLIVALRDELAPILRPRYRIALEERVYVAALETPRFVGRPDVGVVKSRSPASPAGASRTASSVAEPLTVELGYEEVVQRYLEILKPLTRDVIAIVEILSPANKRPGQGRSEYERKRMEIVRSQTHLVEIDLLRNWEPMAFVWPEDGHSSHYRILASRSDLRPRADLYPFNLREPIPRFPLPLLPDDEEPVVDLKKLIDDIYDRAGFDLAIDYRQPPTPPLSDEDAAWAATVLRQMRQSPN
jgi:hypothetical protein